MDKMGEILETKYRPNQMVSIIIKMEPEEISRLRGHMKNVHLFTTHLFNQESEIQARGTNGVTKYFKVPLSIRTRKKYEGPIGYQKIETPSKTFYVYTVKKEQEK